MHLNLKPARKIIYAKSLPHNKWVHITQSSPIPSSMCVTSKRGAFGINYRPYTARTLNGMDYNVIRIDIKRPYINQFTSRLRKMAGDIIHGETVVKG